MKELVFLLEEESAKAMLESLLPRILSPDIAPRLIPFEGKQDLEKQLTKRLRGYQNPRARFIVMRDQDSHPDCRIVKEILKQKIRESGKETVTSVRIACRELESFYLADLQAVESALEISALASQQHKAKFRAPDQLGSPSRELKLLTKQRYQKVGDSRLIGKYLNANNMRSDSFRNLVAAIRKFEQDLVNTP